MLVSELRIFIIQRVFNCMSVIVFNSIVSILLGTQMIFPYTGYMGRKDLELFRWHIQSATVVLRRKVWMQKEQLIMPQSITCLIRTSVISTSGATHPETKAQNKSVQET